MTEIGLGQIEAIWQGLAGIKAGVNTIETILEELAEPTPQWTYPAGSDEYPTRQWYCACWHDPTGVLNDGYGHTGIDLNVDRYPWGDVDRGQPVIAVTDGIIHAVGYSTNYLGGVVIRIDHAGLSLYVRYWHLEDDATFRAWRPGQAVRAGDVIGHIGNYTQGAGGDHLHFDMALDPFEPHYWFTRHPEVCWIDPLPILKAYLDPEIVDAMVFKGQ